MTRSTQEFPALPTAGSHLQDTKELSGHKLAALDGDIGHKTGLGTTWNDLETAFRKLGKRSAKAADDQPSKTEPPAGIA